MTSSTLVAASIAFSRPGMKTRPLDAVSTSVLTWRFFCVTWPLLWQCIWTSKFLYQTMLLPRINWVCNILFSTPMDVNRMLLVKCCNEWCVVLNHYDLGFLSKVIWNPSRFSDYRDHESLSTGIWSLRWLFLYLRSYNLVGSVTATPG
jgi:hypothetical protein